MISIQKSGVLFENGTFRPGEENSGQAVAARSGTIAAKILAAHTRPGSGSILRITVDALASHDLTYVGIIQTARASGMREFPMPYILTNCHNSLCAVGGTINKDDHVFGLSAARKYGGDFVPAHLAVMHQYIREELAACGTMVMGSDSHTRYGALGCMGIGEGGPELVKQLLGQTYDIDPPRVVAVYLTGSPRPGVGPQDVSLALIKAVFSDGLVTNAVLEFIGPGLASLSADYRLGIDVMTTETACLSSIWQTDAAVREYLAAHGRTEAFKELKPDAAAWYDALIRIDLSRVEPMIALPFHPSNAYPIREFKANAADLLALAEQEGARLLPSGAPAPQLRNKLGPKGMQADQAIIAGCSGGTFENIARAAAILKGHSAGSGSFGLSVYPASQSQNLELIRQGLVTNLMLAGAVMRTAFCGPCFGAGDVPGNQGLSLRHTTRNFPNREGSQPRDNQLAYVALMDARSIAATARNKGIITAATELEDVPVEGPLPYRYDRSVYADRIYRGWRHPLPDEALVLGPNIADWPVMQALPENLLLTVGAAIFDPVTTTDELIPSGETASFRSNPYKIAEFALFRREPSYVGRAKAALVLEQARLQALANGLPMPPDVLAEFAAASLSCRERDTGLGSLVFALRPGDGSAREQAASCQKVLGGWANVAQEYATKRYRSNVVNWGMLPFITPNAAKLDIQTGDRIFLPNIRTLLAGDGDTLEASLVRGGQSRPLTLHLPNLTRDERDIILAGSLINYYAEDLK